MSEGDKKKDGQIEPTNIGIFAEAENFEQLFEILQEEEEIGGSGGKMYKAEDLILAIDQFRDEVMKGARRITKTEGLRLKVLQLAIKEAIEGRKASKEIIPEEKESNDGK